MKLSFLRNALYGFATLMFFYRAEYVWTFWDYVAQQLLSCSFFKEFFFYWRSTILLIDLYRSIFLIKSKEHKMNNKEPDKLSRLNVTGLTASRKQTAHNAGLPNFAENITCSIRKVIPQYTIVLKKGYSYFLKAMYQKTTKNLEA